MNIQTNFYCIAVFKPCLASAHTILKKRNYKGNAIVSISSSRVKIIFALLAKSIAIQMQFSKKLFETQALKSCFLRPTGTGILEDKA